MAYENEVEICCFSLPLHPIRVCPQQSLPGSNEMLTDSVGETCLFHTSVTFLGPLGSWAATPSDVDLVAASIDHQTGCQVQAARFA
jgi:hypothetical protein